jgi:hypothetical protein
MDQRLDYELIQKDYPTVVVSQLWVVGSREEEEKMTTTEDQVIPISNRRIGDQYLEVRALTTFSFGSPPSHALRCGDTLRLDQKSLETIRSNGNNS